ncbi:membrane-bound PQQ-dependent dehydrogenase, glucose/quinate/shikimate family [Rhizobium sp. CFBP 8762]|uniref:membrane-bound PQQ-dependent dehydrogenase, glucose/quinate/shikimate family n=1 Tax=Rhizobium sp. CFBP 8762 TaxID=2775279 RepID=UPI00237A274A|nr:membrane-bound PQQ-dependent dehydrogenase, glucose/quinate/shikimate family [Rhizobium sp. CFBP 8762]
MVPRNLAGIGQILLVCLGCIILATGLFMLGGGGYLIVLGGSWYFAPAGLGLSVAGVLLAMRRSAGVALYVIVFAATCGWAVWEVGLAFWPLVSRLLAPAVLALPVLLSLPAFRPRVRAAQLKVSYGLAGVIGLAIVATGYAAFQPIPLAIADNSPSPVPGKAVGTITGANWSQYGRTPSGTRFAPFDQINLENVASLKTAWTYRTGEVPAGGEAHVVTPLHVDGVLYGCTQSNVTFALDADTGKQLWRFDPKAQGKIYPRCRGVSYHDATSGIAQAQPSPAPARLCVRRILTTTVDARLVALDAENGAPCPDFGNAGIVDLRTGMGEVKPGYYFQTSAPTVARDVVIVGGWVYDNMEVNEPSGVVRAFSVTTGELVWAWDLGNPAMTGLPPEGQSYSRGTPNVWSTPAFDDSLGLIYLPTGNATPDFWGGHRTEAAEKYASAVVALDIGTGRERWRFQTVHHDIWDYDIASQPALYDVPDGKGGTVPALIQTTKRGQIFLLDRRDGKPIADVEERPVPQGGVADDRTAPTQPYSVGMPSIGTEPLSESRMWGATLLDQLVCRINFRRYRYEGEFTPLSEKPTLIYPGWSGGMNWGSSSVAENLGYLIVNDIRIGIVNRLIPRTEYDAAVSNGELHGGNAPQAGTPWGIQQHRFLSPIDIPCQLPPYGTITAIDLATKQIVWSMPLGTVEDTGPLGIPLKLPIPIGLPTLGGPVTTASGIIFMAGTQDYYIRALDVRTGRELWKGRLPVGGETTPMTYISPKTGRQYVVISAGGNRSTSIRGDYIIAFALPQSTQPK